MFTQVQANGFLGAGIFAGVGVSGNISNSQGPIKNGATTNGLVIEGNIGWGVAFGGSATFNPNDGQNPIDSIGAPAPTVGAGFGAAGGIGVFTATKYATPTFGDECECQ